MTDGPRIVIAGWAGAGNTGDELLTAWAVAEIHDVGGVAVALSVDPSDTRRRHGVESVRAMSPAALAAIATADGLVVGPGGILQDESSVWSLPAHCLRPAIARLRRIPVVGVGLGVGPLVRPGSGLLLRRSLGSALRLVVRDPESAAQLKGVGLDSTVAPDAAFSAAPRLRGAAQVEPDRIVVSLRNTQVRGRLRVAKRTEIVLDLDGWASALTRLRARLGVPIRFVTFDSTRDGPLHARLARLIGDCECVDADEVSAAMEMERAVVAVAGRYHAAVLAVALGRPLVALGQGAKLPALVAMVGCGSVVVDDPVSRDGLCRSVDAAFSGADTLLESSARLAAEADAHGEAIRLLIEECH